MKTYAIRVPNEVKEKLMNIDKDYIRKVLTEIAGMTYNEEKRLLLIEDIVKKCIEENIGTITVNTTEINEDMTSRAIDSVISIMN